MLRDQITILSAEQIAGALDRHEELLDIPEWGGAIKLRAISVAQRDLVLGQASEPTQNGKTPKVDLQKFLRMLVLYGVIEPVMTEALIADKSWIVIDRIAQAVMRLSGMASEATLTASATFRQES